MSNLYRKKVYTPTPRVIFDPSNKSHLLDYAHFLVYGGWVNGCSYLLEEPYGDIPTMINAKVAAHFLEPHVKKVNNNPIAPRQKVGEIVDAAA